MQNIENVLDALIQAPVVERFSIPPRTERLLPAPEPFCRGQTGDWLKAATGGRDPRRHQSLALRQIGAGRNVVLANSTGSGKTLPFVATIIHELLTGDGTALLFYPQKALAADQYTRIREALALAGLSPDLVGVLDGDVKGQAAREKILQACRVVIATPDVFHSWFMPQHRTELGQRYLSSLRIIVIDETHEYSGIFGTSTAFFFRRFRSAWLAVARNAGAPADLQFIAASGTIRDPARHLAQLTGCPFTAITEEDNGAPFHGLAVIHVEGPACGPRAEAQLTALCNRLADSAEIGAFVAFADTRQGVERVSRALNREDVFPYRSGIKASDRRKIESDLREGELRGVVSTSALELGVDISHFDVTVNLGKPPTRKSLLQRAGRSGRAGPGALIVIAPRKTFTRFGKSLQDYFESDVEPSLLYLENTFIQFQAARCLIREFGLEGGGLPTNVEWPAGFESSFTIAQPGAPRPMELEELVWLEGDNPNFAYSLRAICSVDFAVRDVRDPQNVIEMINLEKAIQEAYPGGTFHHIRKRHRVVGWKYNRGEHSIMMTRDERAARTTGLRTTFISVNPSELIDGRSLSGECGTLAETRMKVTDCVYGIRCEREDLLYSALSENDPRMKSQYREFITTGILLRINRPWFAGKEKSQVARRKRISEALAAALASEHQIAASDVRTAHKLVSLFHHAGPERIEDAIVIFDRVSGGLRLSSPLFDNLPNLLDRLETAIEIAGEDALLPACIVEQLREWHADLAKSGAPQSHPASAWSGSGLSIFAPGSQLAVRRNGMMSEITIGNPRQMHIDDEAKLFYEYESQPGVIALVSHDKVQPIGDAWRCLSWDPATGEMKEMAA